MNSEKMPDHLGVIMPAGAAAPIIYSLIPMPGKPRRFWKLESAQELGGRAVDLDHKLVRAIDIDLGRGARWMPE